MAGNLAAPKEETLYPYDYVCMAYEEDQNLFEDLKQKYEIDIKAYPMTRVTTVQGDATDWIDEANNYYMNVIWPRGTALWGSRRVPIGCYVEEKGVIPQDIEIDKDEIYIVYQQDVR